jgi:4-oxalocrotonate tautomerase
VPDLIIFSSAPHPPGQHHLYRSTSHRILGVLFKEAIHGVDHDEVYRGRLLARPEKRLIADITQAVLAIGGDVRRGITTVILEEVRSGDWAVGGQAFNTDDVLSLSPRREAPNC